MHKLSCGSRFFSALRLSLARPKSSLRPNSITSDNNRLHHGHPWSSISHSSKSLVQNNGFVKSYPILSSLTAPWKHPRATCSLAPSKRLARQNIWYPDHTNIHSEEDVTIESIANIHWSFFFIRLFLHQYGGLYKKRLWFDTSDGTIHGRAYDAAIAWLCPWARFVRCQSYYERKDQNTQQNQSDRCYWGWIHQISGRCRITKRIQCTKSSFGSTKKCCVRSNRQWTRSSQESIRILCEYWAHRTAQIDFCSQFHDRTTFSQSWYHCWCTGKIL